MRVAHRITDLAVNTYGLEPADLIFDALTFPLSTGDDDLRRDAIETMEAIRRIKAEIPGSHTVLGLSNVSFGLKPAARHVLNSVFLHECTEAGLDSAIVHASKILPLNRIPEEQRDVCMDLVWDRRGTAGALSDGNEDYDPLQKLLEIFADVQVQAVEQEDRSDWPVEQRLSQRIIDGDRNGLEDDLDEALARGIPALSIVNDTLLAGMKVVGELFGAGEMQLPFVLQSAETMKKSVAYLEPHMEKADDSGKGRIVLATVKGDVHDIGKNLVDIILTNNGYEVHNIGIKVSIAEMIDKALEVKSDAIGMSGLLVKSTLIMRDNLEELNSRALEGIPVLLGGAALTRTYVERDLREVYKGRLFYGKDAFEGLRVMDRLGEIKRDPSSDDPDWGRAPSDSSVDAAGPLRLRRRRAAGRPARPLAGGRGRQPDLRAAVHRLEDREGHRARRHRGVHQRDRPLPQPVAVPPGEAGGRRQGDRRGVQGPAPAPAARAAGGGEGRRPAQPGASCTATGRATATGRTSSCGRTSRATASSPGSGSRGPARSPTSASPTSSGRSSHPTSTTSRSTS